ncbi:MAG: hypothetical protein CME64_04000 [Halobacteriovoraceae bacterium]|nr:hypothetical protein [Halobacteriovoraceae bacterium]
MKSFLKVKLQDIFQVIRPHSLKLLITLGFMAILSQFTTVNHYLEQFSAPREIINTVSNDSSRAVGTIMNTRWYKSNGFYPYGNVYFRVAHTIHAFSNKTFPEVDMDKIEKVEQSHYYALVLASTLALYALAFLLASFIVKGLIFRLAMTYTFASTFLHSETWTEYLLLAHPDHTLALVTALAALLSFKLIQYPKSSLYFTASAMAWGVATATKMSTLLFYPAILFLVMFPYEKKNWKRFFNYVVIMFLAYQIIGFPQNLSMHRHIAFMLKQSYHSVSPDWGSFTEWLALTLDQIKYPGLFVIIFSILFKKRDQQLKIWKVAVFFLIPFCVLLSRKITSVHHYYPMPFVAMLLVGFIPLIGQMDLQRFFSKKVKFAGLAIIFVVSMTKLNSGMQESLASSYLMHTKCRKQSLKAKSILRNYQKEGFRVLVDPYFPIGTREVDYDRTWGYKLKDLKKNSQISVLGLRETFYERFLSPAPMSQQPDIRVNWDEFGLFYKTFHNQKQVEAVSATWNRVYTDKCGHHIFKKESAQ